MTSHEERIPQLPRLADLERPAEQRRYGTDNYRDVVKSWLEQLTIPDAAQDDLAATISSVSPDSATPVEDTLQREQQNGHAHKSASLNSSALLENGVEKQRRERVQSGNKGNNNNKSNNRNNSNHAAGGDVRERPAAAPVQKLSVSLAPHVDRLDNLLPVLSPMREPTSSSSKKKDSAPAAAVESSGSNMNQNGSIAETRPQAQDTHRSPSPNAEFGPEIAGVLQTYAAALPVGGETVQKAPSQLGMRRETTTEFSDAPDDAHTSMQVHGSPSVPALVAPSPNTLAAAGCVQQPSSPVVVFSKPPANHTLFKRLSQGSSGPEKAPAQSEALPPLVRESTKGNHENAAPSTLPEIKVLAIHKTEAAVVEEVAAAVRNSVTELGQRSSYASQPEMSSLPRLDTAHKSGSNGHGGTLSRSHTSGENDPSQSTVILGLAPLSAKPVREKGQSRSDKKRSSKTDSRPLREKLQLIEDCEETDRQMIEASYNTRTRQLVVDARKQTIVVVEQEHRQRVESKCDESFNLIKRRFMRKFKNRSITERKEASTTKHSSTPHEAGGRHEADPQQQHQDREEMKGTQNGHPSPQRAPDAQDTVEAAQRDDPVPPKAARDEDSAAARSKEKAKAAAQREAVSKPVILPQFTAIPPSNLGAKAPWLPASLVNSWNALQSQVFVSQEDCDTYSNLLFSDGACEMAIHGNGEDGNGGGGAVSTTTTLGESGKPTAAVQLARENLLSLIRSATPEVRFGTPSSPTASDMVNSSSKVFGSDEAVIANMEQDYQRRATPSILPDTLKPVFLLPRQQPGAQEAPTKEDDLLWSLAQLRNQRARNGGGLGASGDVNNAEERRRRWRSRAERQNGGFGNKDQKCEAVQELIKPRSWKQAVWDSSEVLQERLPFLPVCTVFEIPIAAVDPLRDDVFAATYALWRRSKEETAKVTASATTATSESVVASNSKEERPRSVLDTPRFLLHHLESSFAESTKCVGAFLQHIAPNMEMLGIASQVFVQEEGKEPIIENAHANVSSSLVSQLVPTAPALTTAELEGLMGDRLVELATAVECSLLQPFLPPRLQAQPELCDNALDGYRLTDLNIREATWFHQYLEQHSSKWYKSMYDGSPSSPIACAFPMPTLRKEASATERTTGEGAQENDDAVDNNQSSDELSDALLRLFALARRDAMNAEVRKTYPFLCPDYKPDAICSPFASHFLRGVPLEALKVWEDKSFIKLAKRLYEAEVPSAKPGGSCSRYFINAQSGPQSNSSLATQSNSTATAQEIALSLILRSQQDIVRHMASKARSIRSSVLVKHFGEGAIGTLNVLLRYYLPDASEVERNRVGSVTKSVTELHATGAEEGKEQDNASPSYEVVRSAVAGNPESSSTVLSSHNSVNGVTGLLLAAIEPFIISNRSYCSLLSNDASRKPLSPVTLAACITTFFSSNQGFYLENSFPFMKDLDLNRDLTVDDLYPLQNVSVAPYFHQYVVERQKLLTMEWSSESANQLKSHLVALADKIIDAIRISTVYLINTPARARSCSARSRSIPSVSPRALTLTSAAAAAATISAAREEPVEGKEMAHPEEEVADTSEEEQVPEPTQDTKAPQVGSNVAPPVEADLGASIKSGEDHRRNTSPNSGSGRGRPPKTMPKHPVGVHPIHIPRKPLTRAVKGTHDSSASPSPSDTPRSPQELKNSTDTLPSSTNPRPVPQTRPQNHSNESPARHEGAALRGASPPIQAPPQAAAAAGHHSVQSLPFVAPKGTPSGTAPRNYSPRRAGGLALSLPDTDESPQIRYLTTQEKEANPSNPKNAWTSVRGKDPATSLPLSRSATPTQEQSRQHAARRGTNLPQPTSPLGENTALVFYKDNGVDVHETVMLGNQALPSEVYPPLSMLQDTFMEELPSAIASERSGTRSTVSNDLLGAVMQYPNASRNSMPASIPRSNASGTKQSVLAAMQVPQPEASILVKSALANSPPSPQHNRSADAPSPPPRSTNYLRAIPKQPALSELQTQPLMTSAPLHAFATQLQSRGVTPMQALRLGSARPNKRAPPSASHLPQGMESNSFRNARQAFDPPSI